MKDLLLKYKNNKLTFNELQSLRDTLSKVSREEVEKILFEDWQDGEFDCSAQDEQLKSMLDNIKAQIQTSERPTMARFVTFKLICRVVAAVLIPALIVSSIYFYGLSSQQLNNSTVVITGKGETATIVLPDLSTVELKSMSELSYSTTDFNHKTRNIKYRGEGEFYISSDKKHPFIIDLDGLEIKVLGTKFYVYARDSSGTAQVYLEEGSLQLISEASGQKIMMCPNELACLDRSTGQITFSKESDINSNITVVRNGGLIFDNQPLSKVVEQLEINYNYKFIIDSSISDYPFTGILPTGDILETIKILELSFNLHSSIQDKEIRLGRR